jgi:hypothetical protein
MFFKNLIRKGLTTFLLGIFMLLLGTIKMTGQGCNSLTITGTGTQCRPGTDIIIYNTEPGVQYSLWSGNPPSTQIGNPILSYGGNINFGPFYGNDLLSVFADNCVPPPPFGPTVASGYTNYQDIEPPFRFTLSLDPNFNGCKGSSNHNMILNGSEFDVTYKLCKNGIPLYGYSQQGSPPNSLTFSSVPFDWGDYSVLAINNPTQCTSMTSSIHPYTADISTPITISPYTDYISYDIPPTYIDCSWYAAQCAASYYIILCTDDQLTNIVRDEYTSNLYVNGFNYNFQACTDYYWGVLGKNGNYFSTYIQANHLRWQPPTPGNLTATTTGCMIATLSWGVTGTCHDNFNVRIATNQAMTNIVKDDFSGGSLSYTATGLCPGTYWWSVQSTYHGTCSGETTVSTSPFTISLEAPTSLNSSLSSCTTGSSPTTTFFWSLSGTCSGSYELIYSESADFDRLVTHYTGIGTLSYTATGLNSGTTYYWKVSNWYGNCSATSTTATITPQNQSWNLNTGWNLISSHITPTSNDLDNVFQDLGCKLLVVENIKYEQWQPSCQYQRKTDFLTWDDGLSYEVYMSTAGTLCMTGTTVPVNTPISLPNSGWYAIAYYPVMQYQAERALSTSLGNKLVLAKNGNGELYWPQFQINSFEGGSGYMVPGKGYQINVLSNCPNLVYPTTFQRVAEYDQPEQAPKPKHLISQLSRTGNNATLLLLAKNLADNDEIGVFNSQDNLIGSAVVFKGQAVMTIWGNDRTVITSEGAKNDENLSVAVFDSKTLKMQRLNISDISEITKNTKLSNISYKTDGIYIVTTNDSSSASKLSISNYPNPFDQSTTIEWFLPEAGIADVSIYNLYGEKVMNIASGEFKAGLHSSEFFNTKLISGCYSLVLNFNSQKISKPIIIDK